jgi:hypothetical protein
MLSNQNISGCLFFIAFILFSHALHIYPNKITYIDDDEDEAIPTNNTRLSQFIP